MAQLSKDIFGRGGELVAIEEIAALIAERTPVVAGEQTVALADADGRTLARDLVAPLDLPGFDNSAVDGYAVVHADLGASGETVLPVVSRIAAGHAPDAARLAAAAARVFTGAPLPPGADTVFMQEDVRILEDGRVAPPPAWPGAPTQGRAARTSRRARSRFWRGSASIRAISRSPPRSASPNSRCGVLCASPYFRPATRSPRPARACRPRASTTPIVSR